MFLHLVRKNHNTAIWDYPTICRYLQIVG